MSTLLRTPHSVLRCEARTQFSLKLKRGRSIILFDVKTLRPPASGEKRNCFLNSNFLSFLPCPALGQGGRAGR